MRPGVRIISRKESPRKLSWEGEERIGEAKAKAKAKATGASRGRQGEWERQRRRRRRRRRRNREVRRRPANSTKDRSEPVGKPRGPL